MMVRFVFLLSLFCLLPSGIQAGDDLPLPRFVSIKSEKANIRTGPGKRYPIKWEVVRKNTPVEVISEFEQWRRIRDVTGDEGWIYQGMLSGARFAIVQSSGTLILRRSDNADSSPVAKLEQGVSVRLKACVREWCEVEKDKISGWLPRGSLWGVYPTENFNR